MRIALVAVAAAVLTLTACTAGPVAAPSQSSPPDTSATPTPTSEPTIAANWVTAADPTTFEVMDPVLFAYTDPGDAGTGDFPWVNFVSPSTNLGCAIWDDSHGGVPEIQWGCAAAEFDWEFPSDSPDDYCYDAQVPCGGGIEVTGTELPHPRYRGDPGFPAGISIHNANAPPYTVRVLQYGQSVSLNDITCYSEQRGVTCVHGTSGHGFVIARDLNEIF